MLQPATFKSIQDAHALMHAERSRMMYLNDFQMADIELGNGLGPHTHTNLLGWRGILPNQHLPQVLVDLHKPVGMGECMPR